MARSEQIEKNTSIFASPRLLDEFSEALLSLDDHASNYSISLAEGTSRELRDVKNFLEEFYKSSLEKLTFYYFLLVRDSSNLVRLVFP